MAQYIKTTWVNDEAPALNATNLNKQEQGIYDNSLHAESTHAPSTADKTSDNETSHGDVLVDGDINSTVAGVELQNLVAVDLNTITTTGRYSSQNNCSNMPEAEKGYVMVFKDITSTDNIGQFYFSGATNYQWFRQTSDGGSNWSTWAIVYQPYDANIVSDASYVHTDNNFTDALKAEYDANEPNDATTLLDADIGVSVQAYDADTAKTDVAQTYTEPQRTSVSAGDNSIAFNDSQNFSFTATAANVTVTDQTEEQSGYIRTFSSELISGWGAEFFWGSQGEPTDLTGTEVFGYEIMDASGAESIAIGRL